MWWIVVSSCLILCSKVVWMPHFHVGEMQDARQALEYRFNTISHDTQVYTKPFADEWHQEQQFYWANQEQNQHLFDMLWQLWSCSRSFILYWELGLGGYLGFGRHSLWCSLFVGISRILTKLNQAFSLGVGPPKSYKLWQTLCSCAHAPNHLHPWSTTVFEHLLL